MVNLAKCKVFRIDYDTYGEVSREEAKEIFIEWKQKYYSLDKADIQHIDPIFCYHCKNTIGYAIYYLIKPKHIQRRLDG